MSNLTPEQTKLRDDANKTLKDAEIAWHKYACSLEIGLQRTFAFEVFAIVRTAPREANLKTKD